MTVPKVFVSYSHDSQQHKKWVLEFATRLRQAGIDANLDLWALKPGDPLSRFVDSQLKKADRVILICTRKYVEQANAAQGHDKMLISKELFKSLDKGAVIPVIKQNGGHQVPRFLRAAKGIDFSRPDDYEFSMDELLRRLYGRPLIDKPPLGNDLFSGPAPPDLGRQDDNIKRLIQVLVSDYEQGEQWSSFEHIKQSLAASQIMLDLLIDTAVKRKLIQHGHHEGGHFARLTNEGKFYAIDARLVSLN